VLATASRLHCTELKALTRFFALPRLAVVFDTNAYRTIGEAAFEQLQNDERHHSVLPLASYVVAIELLAHLATEIDPDFGPCLHATARLGRHCSRWNGSASNLEFVQLADAQIARQLFGKTLVSEEIRSGGVATVIGAITDDPRRPTALQFKDGLEQLRDGISRAEKDFVYRLWNKVVLTLAPDAKDWQSVMKSAKRAQILAAIDSGRGLDLIAATIVDRAAEKCALSLTAVEREEASRRARILFPTAIHHHDLLIRNIIERGPKMERPERANSVWDHEITFSTAPGAEIQGVPVILVTSDPMILQAAVAAGTISQVWSLTDYRSRLSGREQFIDTYV
jgi:hypothetical protein